ncbi:unnamed protein product [Zymoseptoria tritici ST99CH_3D7]|uniref:RNI-like protein n=1 Tax=Zymoseptoria tritici (strain ST99CH_3D7) TaxID=1276538 RepID=A0A1X7REZ3_ZYMT9|nr:unnamed protein product [Zymoseptoria tritici ST99CH_3D7]
MTPDSPAGAIPTTPPTDDSTPTAVQLLFLLQTWRLQFENNTFAIHASDMENIHGVDVSWMHKPKGHERQRSATVPSSHPPSQPRDIKAKTNGASRLPSPQPQSVGNTTSRSSYFPGPVTPASISKPAKDPTTAVPTPSTPSSTTPSRPQSRRPSLLKRASSEKLNGDGKSLSRKGSWMSSLSSKFSSTSELASSPNVPSPAANANGTTRLDGAQEEAEPYVPSTPKGSSFFSSLTRKLSAGQSGTVPRANTKTGVCQRRVLNVDPNRQRCLVQELDVSRLRKVSFCVDVEIAGGPRYKDDDEDDQERKRKKKDVRVKERAEGEALKNPEAAQDEADEAKLASKSKPLPIPKEETTGDSRNSPREESVSPPVGNVGSVEGHAGSDKKREKKKRSEEERKERKEKRRRRAEENGTIPVELPMDGESPLPEMSSSMTSASLPTTHGEPVNTKTPPKRDRPTTDPVRIYRRCCQLRETPILKRITEQLMSPTCCVPEQPGTVFCLDLNGSRLQLADMVTLGDWLAVVPVKKLLLDDADLSDEGLRCILAGLLAAKRPEPMKRRSTSPKHREAVPVKHREERSGVVEKLSLKNNSRITRIGWKHISLFLCMCSSIKAIDLSMIQFPETLPPSAQASAVKPLQNSPNGSDQDMDAAEILFKCLSQRLGGNKLEELLVSQCGMTASQIRKVVDGAVLCGISRLGLAGNQLDDEGLDAVLHYLKSGVCHALDIGGNDLRDKIDQVAEALESKPGTWGLSLADCNLDTESIRPLFPVLAKLPGFRFIDLSHNPDLCSKDNGTISLLRRYLGQMKDLKRMHLSDVGMSPKQAIALADVLPEAPQLAHFAIMDNPQLSALASAKDEESQEEACALFASYMAAVRVSSTLMCIDIDVPSADNSEIVKALAKQVVAYSLRNMERVALADITGMPSAAATADAAASITQAHGGEQQLKEIAVPDVLMHLVGHVEGSSESHDNDEPAPDDDYIVGGTGVVKALQYVLGENADDLRRGSATASPTGGKSAQGRQDGSAGLETEQQGKAKKMSKNLLDSARKIRARLQPALRKEATTGDEMAYRRLVFLDQTLQSMIQRFEEEYPETRVAPPSPKRLSQASYDTEPVAPLSIMTQSTEPAQKSDDEDELDDGVKPAFSRHNSDVSLASRALAIEEGHLHRLGQRMRRSVVDSPLAIAADDDSLAWKAQEEARLESVKMRIESITGPELKQLVEQDGWDVVLEKLGANMNDLRALQEQDPNSWEEFKEAQLKAKMNVAQDAR